MQEKSLFNESLLKIYFIFRLAGFNIDNKKRSIKQNCIYIYNVAGLLFDVICIISRGIDDIKSGEDFQSITFNAPFLTFGILAEIKGFFLLLNEIKVRALIDSIRDLEVKAKEFESSERNSTIKTKIKLLNTIINTLSLLHCVLLPVYNITPIVLSLVKYVTTGVLELELPFLDVYPFDALDLRYYPFVYVRQICSALTILLMIGAADYFLFTCCTHISIQFNLLQQQFQELIPIKHISEEKPIDQMTVRGKFKQLVKWHQKIISSANMLEGIYSYPALANFFISSFVISVTGFNATKIHDIALPLLMPYIMFLFICMSQIFLVCLFGDILMRSSMDVADAVYNSRWYLSDVVMRKQVLLVLTRAQIPCKLTAAGYADVNLKAYMTVLSTSWSYFALLQTIYSSRS